MHKLHLREPCISGYSSRVKRPVAVDRRLTEDGGVVLTFYGDIPLANRRRERRHRLDPTRQHPLLGSLAVWFRREDPNDSTSAPTGIDEVSLRLAGGVTPTDLQRFAWSRWLRVAETVAQTGGDPSPRSTTDPDPVSKEITRAVYEEHGLPLPVRRPGRGGHPPSHYQEIADRYKDLRLQGVRSPVRQIAAERRARPNTVAGWIRRARELGMLPPAAKRT